MDYIRRTLEQKILDISEDYSCLLLIGPRQVGKTTMLEHLMKGTDRQKVTLDDVENRKLAKADPALFLELHPAPVLIDEVQYSPELFFIPAGLNSALSLRLSELLFQKPAESAKNLYSMVSSPGTGSFFFLQMPPSKAFR